MNALMPIDMPMAIAVCLVLAVVVILLVLIRGGFSSVRGERK